MELHAFLAPLHSCQLFRSFCSCLAPFCFCSTRPRNPESAQTSPYVSGGPTHGPQQRTKHKTTEGRKAAYSTPAARGGLSHAELQSGKSVFGFSCCVPTAPVWPLFSAHCGKSRKQICPSFLSSMRRWVLCCFLILFRTRLLQKLHKKACP